MDIDRDTHEQASPLLPHTAQTQGHTLSEGTPAMSAAAPSASQVADALERRLRERREAEQQAAANSAYRPFDEDHDKRQEFRRMIDPAILRPNPRPVALESLKVNPSLKRKH